MYILKRGNKIFKVDNEIYGYTGVNPDPLNKAYGIIYDSNRPQTDLQRIGNMAKHASLPVQSGMRRCLLNDDGTVNYYLDDNDSTLKEDGVTASVLDGTDGQVMVEIPEHWEFFKKEGALDYVYISDEEISGFKHIPKSYYGAYWGRIISNKLTSVSGGIPSVSQSRTSFRNYARVRGGVNWNIDNYYQRKIILWLFMIEYAQSNSQAALISTLSDEGFRQGGLGVGVTEYWPGSAYVPNGQTNELGNNTGEVIYPYGGRGIHVNSYRGIEQPFGHLDSWTDGINIRSRSSSDGGKLELWSADDPTDWNDTTYTGYELRGNMQRASYYVRKIIGNGDFIGSDQAGSGNEYSYMCDMNYNPGVSGSETLYGVRCGGTAVNGSSAGLAYAYAAGAPTFALASIGSRLCYLP